MSKKKVENQEDEFMRREQAEIVLDKKREERLLTKEQRIQQIIDEAIIQEDKKHFDLDDEDTEVLPTFDIKIDIKEVGSIKATIQKKDLDIFELKYLVENLDNINQSIDFFKLKEKREEEEKIQEEEALKKE